MCDESVNPFLHDGPIRVEEVPPGSLRTVHVKGRAVCLANVEGRLYAVSDTCTHAQISLSGGALMGRQVICPWHGAMFDLETGRATCGPAEDPVRTYPVRVDEATGVIEIDVENPNPDAVHG